MGRDHSETCEACGCQRGGFNDYMCRCDYDTLAQRALNARSARQRDACACIVAMVALADNLAWAGALCESFHRGTQLALWSCVGNGSGWRPGCRREAP